MCPSRHKNGSNVGIPVVSFGMSLDASALSELQDSPELRHGTFTERTEWCGKSVARSQRPSDGPVSRLEMRAVVIRGVSLT